MVTKVRMILAAASLAFGLLVLFQPPTVWLWEATLAATEYGHWFLLLPLAVALTGTERVASRLATAIAMVAMALLASTSVRAFRIAGDLPGALASAFHREAGPEAPFPIGLLWLGTNPTGPAPEVLAYREVDGQALHLELYRSARPEPAPCIVVLHTGGWNNGTPREFIPWNYYWASRGYAVAALEYQLAPKARWPAQSEDVLAALQFLKRESERLGIDPTSFVLLGRSAGGHIAETVAYAAKDPAIRGCIAFYAPADLQFAYEYAKADDILNSPRLLRDLLGGGPREAAANYESASANRFVDALSPPTLLLHGPSDPLVWYKQSERLAEKLRLAGVPHYLATLPWATHAFDYNFHGPSGQVARYAVDFFLQSVTSAAGPSQTAPDRNPVPPAGAGSPDRSPPAESSRVP